MSTIPESNRGQATQSLARPHSRGVLLTVFAIVFIAHVTFFFVMRPVYSDWAPEKIARNGWFAVADNLASGRGYTIGASLTYFSTSRLVPTAARGPLPVLLLAAYIRLFSAPYFPVLITAWLLSAGNALLIYAITWKLTRRRTLALVVALLSGLHLSEMWINTTFSYAGEPLFMHLFAWTMLATIFALERGTVAKAITAGALLGAACLARPTVVFLPALFLVLFPLVWGRRGAWLAVLACLAWAAPQVPWVLRNQAAFGRPVLTSTLGGYALYVAATAARDDRVHLTGWDLDQRDLHREMLSVLERTGRTVDDVNETEFDDTLRAAAFDIIAADRRAYVRNSAMGAIGIWFWLNSGRGAYMIQNAIYYVLALIGLVIAIRQRLWPVLALLVLHAYAVGVHLPVLPQYRYMVPFTPYLFVFSGLALTQLIPGLRTAAPPFTTAFAKTTPV